MLTLTRKKYEIEEPIQIKGENEEVLFEYLMRITPEEKLEIQNIIFDEQDVKDGRLLQKLQSKGETDEYLELEAKVMERAKERQKQFENIVFKDQTDKIKEIAGESGYLDLVDMLFDFFVKTFVDKRASQMNTLNTHLRKISNN